METETSLIPWNVPFVSGNFAQDFANFIEATSTYSQGLFEAQLYYSHIIQNETWEQARVWFIPGTNEIYEDESLIPANLVSVVSDRQRFNVQEDFVGWCRDRIPGFVRSSFWRRHKRVDMLTELGWSLPKAVAWLMQKGIGDGVSDRVLGLLEWDDVHNVIGVNEEAIHRLPEQLLPDDYDELEGQERIEAAKGAVREFAEEKLASAQAGDTRIGPDIDRNVYKKPQIRVVTCGDDDIFPYKFTITRWPDEDNGFEEGRFSEIFIQFIDGTTGEVLDDLPPEVKDWWYRRVKVKGY